jgi:hypothetical protein
MMKSISKSTAFAVLFPVSAGLATAAIGFLGASGCATTYAHYGAPMHIEDQQPIPLAKVVAHPDKYADEAVLVKGEVTSVCAKKGCWLRMTDAGMDEDVFVKFTCPVEGRLVPMEAVGHEVIVEGTLIIDEISEGEARHYKEDAGASEEEIAKIVGPQKQIRISSPSAKIKGIKG